MPSTNRIAEAFRERYNTIGLAAVAATAAAALSPIPLLLGLVAEAAYLLFVPDSKWYEARLSKRFDAEVDARRERLKQKVIPTLTPDLQDDFARLEAARKSIGEQEFEDAHWFREVLRKLDYLLEKFLLFASKQSEYRSYLRQVHDDALETTRSSAELSFDIRDRRGGGSGARVRILPQDGLGSGTAEDWTTRMVEDIQKRYDGELEEINRGVAAEQDENTKAVLQKRLDVVTRRREFVGKLGRIVANLTHQIQLVHDTFGLISDEIRARSPEQILADIDDVVYQTDSMTSLLEELAPYEQMSERLAV